jgi:hypothetical protein
MDIVQKSNSNNVVVSVIVDFVLVADGVVVFLKLVSIE